VLLQLKYFYDDVPIGPEPVTYPANGPRMSKRAVQRGCYIGQHSMLSRVGKQLSVMDM
jgi:hypothetical protein